MNRKDCRKVEAVHNRDYRREIVDLLRSNLCPKAKEEMLHTYHEKDIATALEVLDFQERRDYTLRQMQKYWQIFLRMRKIRSDI